jgi:hypothetical protein
MKGKVFHTLLLGFIFCFTVTGIAGDKAGEEINWQVISSGGSINGTSTNYQLSGTVAQTAVGSGSSTNYGLSHGFWQEFDTGGPGCCDMPGDANDNGSVNILDITYLIAYLYKSGPAPPCNDEADATGNNVVNILDITYLISYLYKGGPAPICGTTGT